MQDATQNAPFDRRPSGRRAGRTAGRNGGRTAGRTAGRTGSGTAGPFVQRLLPLDMSGAGDCRVAAGSAILEVSIAIGAAAARGASPPAQAAPEPAELLEPPAPLDGPANLRVAALASTRVRLTWTDRSRNETGFVVERWQEGRTWARVATTVANATTFTDATATPATRYAYRVRAVVGSTVGASSGATVGAAAARLSASTAIVWVRTPPRGRPA